MSQNFKKEAGCPKPENKADFYHNTISVSRVSLSYFLINIGQNDGIRHVPRKQRRRAFPASFLVAKSSGGCGQVIFLSPEYE